MKPHLCILTNDHAEVPCWFWMGFGSNCGGRSNKKYLWECVEHGSYVGLNETKPTDVVDVSDRHMFYRRQRVLPKNNDATLSWG